MVRPKRIDRTDLRREIRDTAWRQIAENGAAALSLRAIARALHITAPAIYNYYPSRDDLVTALILEAFTAMGDAQYSALQAAPAGDPHARLAALGLAYRQWALTYPHHYQLIFGTPLAGYRAPAEITGPAAARSMTPLIVCLDAACEEGKLRIYLEQGLPASLLPQFDTWKAVYPVSHIEAFYAAVVIWSRVHGLVSPEIGNQFPPFFADLNRFYSLQIDGIVKEFLT